MQSRTSVLWLTVGALTAAGCPLEPLKAPPACSLGACDDANACTSDRCDVTTGRCVFMPLPEGTVCEHDNDACNGVDRCDETGQCVVGAPLQVTDNDVCTTDICDALTGVISHPFIADCTTGEGGGSGVGGAGGAPVAPPNWTPLASKDAPSPRRLHSAVWTGKKMLVWGGLGAGGVTKTGAAYNPETNTWTPLAVADAPVARHSHSAVWTGSEMIIWGGFSNAYESTGGRYDPQHDTWKPLPFTTIKGRARHAAVWTGGELIVWGGSNGIGPLGDGARYMLSSDAWAGLPSGGPSARFNAAAVWTGSVLAIWGGTDTFDWFSDGRYLNPGQNAWSNISTTNRPGLRESSSVAWTGSEMLLWGGWNGGDFYSDGFALKPAGASNAGTWKPIDTSLELSARSQNVAVWTGEELCVWGGCGGESCEDTREDGGCYSVVNNSWRSLPSEPTFPGRVGASAVWTSKEIIVFGGTRDGKVVEGGGRLVPENIAP